MRYRITRWQLWGGSRTCYALVCSIYIAERKKRRGCFPPTGSKHYSFLRLFHPLRPGFQQDYAVAAAASSATWDACCSVQMRLRSPYTLSTRPVVGQNLAPRSHAAGNAAYSLEYGLVHVSLIKSWGGWGAPFRTLLSVSALPFSISAISSLMEIRASQNLSSSAWQDKMMWH